MNEHLLQFIWQFRYFNTSELITTAGEPIQIIHPGFLNPNQGPDFLDARIKIADTLWVGSVEVHLKTSGWQKHGHQNDANYKNVILHVVYEDDREFSRTPVLELQTRIAPGLLQKYQQLMQGKHFIPCEKLIHTVPQIIMHSWMERLLAERLTRKAQTISIYQELNKHHWEESFWWLLAKNFGTKVNAASFQAIAQSLPLPILARHKTNVIQLEALLLGQAALLSQDFNDKYLQLLKKEYFFLKTKYQLQNVTLPIHFSKMRPGNFPTIRLAQLAAVIHQSAHLFSRVIEEKNLATVKTWFKTSPNNFWNYHYTTNDEPQYIEKPLGDEMINNIIINTIAPMLFAYGNAHQVQHLKNKAIEWLQKIPSEKNIITSGFKKIGIVSTSAQTSQSLIELKTQYCDKKLCLQCAIGNNLLKQ